MFKVQLFSPRSGAMYVMSAKYGILSLSRAVLWLYQCLKSNLLNSDILFTQNGIQSGRRTDAINLSNKHLCFRENGCYVEILLAAATLGKFVFGIRRALCLKQSLVKKHNYLSKMWKKTWACMMNFNMEAVNHYHYFLHMFWCIWFI